MTIEPAKQSAEGSLGGFDQAKAKVRAEALVGKVIADRYRIHNVLAMGGMGAVFTGEHVHMRKRVAIKVLHPDTEGLPGLVARFEREAIVGAHVEHRNVASARDFGRMTDGSYYLVLEFVSGLTLRQLMSKGLLPIGRTLKIAKQMATALAKVHAKGIIHRDVNPRNVMVVGGSKDLIKLIDFGFAKVPVERFSAMSTTSSRPVAPSQITGDGVIFGTIGYLAPEAALGMQEVDARSDLYALGAILYEMLSGQPPFTADSPASHYFKHRFDPVPAMSERAPSVAVLKAHEEIAMRLLAKDPDARYQTADEVIRVLDRAISALGQDEISIDVAVDDVADLTVAGAENDVPLPRFEDVADPASSKAHAARKRSIPPPSRQGSPIQAEPPAPEKGSSWFFWSVIVSILGGCGVYALIHFGVIGKRLSGSSFSAPVAVETSAAPSASAEAPVPGASSSLAVSASAALTEAPVTEVGGFDADVWRKVVWQAPSSRDYTHAIQGIYALAKLDPKAFTTAEMKTAAVDVLANSSPDQAGKLVQTMSDSFGTDGLDVLYDLVTLRGGAAAAKLGTELLAKPEVKERASKGLQIAIELRQTACRDRIGLLDRAVKEGDARTLGILVAIRSPQCDISTGACCLPQNPELEKAVIEMTNRLERH